MPNLCGDDEYAWTQQQAQVIRTGHWEAIDRERLAKAVEEGWKSEWYPHRVQSRTYPPGQCPGMVCRDHLQDSIDLSQQYIDRMPLMLDEQNRQRRSIASHPGETSEGNEREAIEPVGDGQRIMRNRMIANDRIEDEAIKPAILVRMSRSARGANDGNERGSSGITPDDSHTHDGRTPGRLTTERTSGGGATMDQPPAATPMNADVFRSRREPCATK